MISLTKKTIFLSLTLIIMLIIAGCSGISGSNTKEGKIMLWNGKDLTGWKEVYSQTQESVWTVRNGVLYTEGRPNGYLRTKKEYSNYKLHVEWRWPENAARGAARNSGVFIHSSDSGGEWPKTIECQLRAGNAGQIVLINGTGITIDGVNKQNQDAQYVLIPAKQQSSENPAGQWNSYDIICDGDTIQCYVNDILQNEGTAVKPSSGYICLQSEGSPIEFRNIYIEKLSE